MALRLRRGARVEPVVQLPPARLVPDLRGALGSIEPFLDLAERTGIDPLHASTVVADHHSTGASLVAALQAGASADERTMAEQISAVFNVPFADLRAVTPLPEAMVWVSAADAHRFGILPVRYDETALYVIVIDPFDAEMLARLERLSVRTVALAVAAAGDARIAINRAYPALDEVGEYVDAFATSGIGAPLPFDDSVSLDLDDDAPVVQVVNRIVTQALRERSSDVHIEPVDDRVRVRYRVDGALKEVLSLPVEMGPALVSRIKIMADMNIVERRRPQDGQFQMSVDGRDLDVRVSTTLTIWGEKTVLRLLDKSRSLYRLSELGMPPEIHEAYSAIVRSPFGMVVVSGPTGSGKTTTLYATLSEINRPDINVMTIEDPVEYIFPSINQIQISEQAGLGFATGLKSILRQDPDVILVGEVRDAETARIAVQSALTGHLVLSSVHAIDSVSALYRLLDMGLESFLVTSSIVGVVAQRLVRRICSSCVVTYEPSDAERLMFSRMGGDDTMEWKRGEGCNLCSGTGYYDRIGVYEVLAVNDDIRALVMEQRTPREARSAAVAKGLRTLRMEAVRLIEEGRTTVDEVIRHVFVAEDLA